MRLARLHIKNLAVIDDLEIHFEKGLNIITGETGAGKSVLVSSLDLILGKKTDPDLIRTGEDKMTVEAEFQNIPSDFAAVLEKAGLEPEDGLVIRRETARSKRSRIFINDSPANSDTLNFIASGLIDMHGQHDHQALLDPGNHLFMLDTFAMIRTENVSSLTNEYSELRKEIERLSGEEKDLNDRKELLEYHLKEINEVSPAENEDEQISLELRKMEKVEDLKKICRSVSELTEGDHGSVLRSIRALEDKCGELSDTDREFRPFMEDIESAYQAVKEFSSACSLYESSLEFDGEKYAYLSERYTKLKKLMKKFGPELKDVLNYASEAQEQLDSIGSVGFDREKLQKKAAELDAKIKKECAALTAARKAGAERFETAIKSEFAEVGLKDSELKVSIESRSVSETGADAVEFYIRTNIGEDFKPLAKIASGGEISRIMLSIKNITGSGTRSAVSIFDEIDSGISGRIAEKVGDKLLNLSGSRQVIVITHLPAIASKGETHFSVRKKVSGQRTFVEVIRLDKKQRAEEIASLISSGSASEDLKRTAGKMLEGGK